jgi:hypothetical protein
MLKLLPVILSLSLSAIAFGKDVYVQGHVRKDGTYVQPHFRTAPDSNPYNNYSTQGNTNPYTGKKGTVNPYNTHTHQNSLDFGNSNIEE